MKLLQLTNRYYFLAFTIAVGVVASSSYYIIKHVIDREFNEKLHAEKQQFIDEFNTYDNLDKILYLNIGDIISVHETTASDPKIEVLSDTSMFDNYENKQLDYRKLSFSTQHDGKIFRVTILKSLVNNNDLLEALAEIMLMVASLFTLSLVVINVLITKKIWSPFYETLHRFRAFNIKAPHRIVLPKSKVSEFNVLNQAVEEVTDQTTTDYQILKEYTENAAHEIQTPLAIIQNKTELMMQKLTDEEQIRDLSVIRSATIRLSKLKEGLALFAKIDNHQFVDTQPINLHSFLDALIENVADLIKIKGITLSKTVESEPVLNLNETLAYVLFNNLISNAIKYNLEHGKLDVGIKSNSLVISNSGEPMEVDPKLLFERFKRQGRGKDSSGLGLSLAKRIVEYYEMEITYIYQEGQHIVTVSWLVSK